MSALLMHAQQGLICSNKMHAQMQDVCLHTQALTLKHTRINMFQTTDGTTLIPETPVLMCAFDLGFPP